MYLKALVVFLFSISICYSNTNRFEVVVFSAPVLKEANSKSIVLERLKKGDQVLTRNKNTISSKDGSLLYRIITKSGIDGYINQGHVQPSTLQALNNNFFDETDYRSRMNSLHKEGSLLYNSKIIFLGSFPKPISSSATDKISISDQSFSYGLGYTFSKKIKIATKNKYYVGGAFRYFYDKSSFLNSNSDLFNETLAAYSLGPTFSFFTKNVLNFHNEVMIGPTLSLVNQSTSLGDISSNYQTLTPGLHISNYLGIKNIIPKIDFIFGLSFDLNFLKLKKKNNVNLPSFSNDLSIDNPYFLQASMIIGFQVNQ
jgi:hypothetical protein